MTGGLRARHEIDFVYRRSLGDAERAFLAGLAACEIWGSVDAGGKVTVPPVDWDPETGAPSAGFVRVGDVGTVTSWTWAADPAPGQPEGAPQALALIRLQGADTGMLHYVDVAGPDLMATGMTVRANWRHERTGQITDIRAFVPCPVPDEEQRLPTHQPARTDPDLAVTSEVQLTYTYEPGLTVSRFLRLLPERRIEGGRCPACAAVYVPPRPQCPICRVGPLAPVPVADRGTVTTFTVVHLPFHGMTGELPFVSAWIRLDGASVPFTHLLGRIAPEDVRVGLPVEAVWAEGEDLAPTWESIRYFKPVAGPEPA